MSDYWTGLLSFTEKKKTEVQQHRYFRAEVDEIGEVDGEIVEVNFIEERDRIREQIQEDIICFIDSVIPASSDEYRKNVLCKIVVDNFKGFE